LGEKDGKLRVKRGKIPAVNRDGALKLDGDGNTKNSSPVPCETPKNSYYNQQKRGKLAVSKQEIGNAIGSQEGTNYTPQKGHTKVNLG